ncbi:MAG: DUF2007 domain-containing protein [Muribaculaceae bacterium]|nr:DUF2007 domain-containing protein [Muribaculaceae bacterium]
MEQNNQDNERLVVFGRYENAVDANIVKGVLETNGVAAGVIGDSTANALMMTPMMVVVFERDLEQARQVMDSRPEHPEPAED